MSKKKKKESTPTYTIRMRLKTEVWQEHLLNKKMKFARKLYNHVLGEAKRRVEKAVRRTCAKVKHDNRNSKTKEGKEWWKTFNKEISGTGRSVTAYSLDREICTPYRVNHDKLIPSDVFTFISALVAQAVDDNRKKAFRGRWHFKKWNETVSLRGHKNVGISYKNGNVDVGLRGDVHKKLSIPTIIRKNDAYIQKSLHDRIKFCQIVKEVRRGKDVFYAILYMEGYPPMKERTTQKDKKVGIDIGVSTVAAVSDDEIMLEELAKGLQVDQDKLTRLQRKMDRQRRSNNPHKFNENGTVKRNREKWIISNNYKKTRAKVTDLHRLIAAKRKVSHETMANRIIEMGDNIKVETMNFAGLQKRSKNTSVNEKTGRFNSKKRFGKTLAHRAPAMLISIIDRKLKYHKSSIKKVDTVKLKASQYNHVADEYVKKPLSQRYAEIGVNMIQRDLYSAYLLQNVRDTDKLDEYNKDDLDKKFDKFLYMHDILIDEMKKSGEKRTSSIGF